MKMIVAITFLIVRTSIIDYHFVNGKMIGISMTIFEAGINVLAFVGTKCTFSKIGLVDAKVNRKRHCFAEGKLQKEKDKWSKDRVKQLDFINQSLCENNEAKA